MSEWLLKSLMKYTYITDILVEGKSGKEKATNEKFKVLVNRDSFLLYPRRTGKEKSATLLWLAKTITTLIKEKHEIFLIERTNFLVFLLPIILCKRNLRLISDVHANQLEEERILSSRISVIRIPKRILLWLNDLIRIYLSSGIILNNERLRKRYQNPNFIISYNAIDSDFALNNSFKISKSPLRNFVFVGSGAPWHGLPELIKAWKGLDSSLVLNIVGLSGVDLENVKFHGKIYGVELSCYLRKMDAFVLPYSDMRLSPGSPIKLYEYLMHRKPILVKAGRGYSDEVLKYKAGIAYENSSTEELCMAIEALKSSSENDELYLENYKDMIKTFTWETRIDQWEIWLKGNF